MDVGEIKTLWGAHSLYKRVSAEFQFIMIEWDSENKNLTSTESVDWKKTPKRIKWEWNETDFYFL